MLSGTEAVKFQPNYIGKWAARRGRAPMRGKLREYSVKVLQIVRILFALLKLVLRGSYDSHMANFSPAETSARFEGISLKSSILTDPRLELIRIEAKKLSISQSSEFWFYIGHLLMTKIIFSSHIRTF